MDAKPHRPNRAARPRIGDENIAPTLPGGKTIHHGNKSTPALPTLVGLGGVRDAPKRTAFGDLSNTANTVRISRDDSAITNKNGPEKPAVVQDKKFVPRYQPAQRPGSIASSKVLTNTSEQVPKQSATDRSAHQQTGTRKTLTTRSTIFRDPVLPSVPEPRVEKTDAKHTTVSKPTQSRASTIAARDTKAETKSYDEDTNEQNESNPAVEAKESAKKVPGETISNIHTSYDRTLPSEPEEYSDEEYNDNYEEDGYVTVHSQGDNTTGGVTTLLFPRVNGQVTREIAEAGQIVRASQTEDDILDEIEDVTMVAHYGDEIFEYMREMERKMLPNPHYMDNQAEIQWSMRSVLMDWLVQVHARFHMLPETLFLCVNYVDRFLSCKVVSLGKLQLVGVTALFIAAKYEEVSCPSVQEFVYMVDEGYSADEIFKAERFMLSMLQYELGWPGPMSFLRRISKADDYDLETRTLAKYFLEITIMDERFVATPPSYVAAAAHCLARMMLRRGDWSPAHVYYANYTYDQLYPLMVTIFQCCRNPFKHHASIYEKYKDRRFRSASVYVQEQFLERGFGIHDLPRTSGTLRISSGRNSISWRRN